MNYDELEPLTDHQRRMVEANMGLVNHVVFKMHGMRDGDEADDMLCAGYFGLMRATQKFEPERGFRFSTYAIFWIRQAIQKGREDFEGVNYRAWKAGRRDKWEPTLSMDSVAPGEGEDRYGRLASPIDVEAEIVASLGLVRKSAYAGCDDDVDRFIVDGLAEGRTLAAMADELGVSRETVRRRRRLISHRVGGTPEMAYG